MLFVPSTVEDIQKYYRHSYLKFKETGDMLFHLEHVDRTMIAGTIEDGRDFKLYLAEEEPYEVDYILPHKSFFQNGEHAMMLERIPAKQYHRGITDENTKVCYRKNGPGDEIKQVPLNFGVLKAFVQKQKFRPLSEAIKDPAFSSALSPRMMYARGPRQIYVDFLPVAKITDFKTKTISMLAPIFKQELVDLLTSYQEQHIFKIV
jgi:hypothetical protein